MADMNNVSIPRVEDNSESAPAQTESANLNNSSSSNGSGNGKGSKRNKELDSTLKSRAEDSKKSGGKKSGLKNSLKSNNDDSKDRNLDLSGISANNDADKSAIKAVKAEHKEEDDKKAQKDDNRTLKKAGKKAATTTASHLGRLAFMNQFFLIMKSLFGMLGLGLKMMLGGIMSLFSAIGGLAISFVTSVASALGISTLAAGLGVGCVVVFGVVAGVGGIMSAKDSMEVAVKDVSYVEDTLDCDIGNNNSRTSGDDNVDVDAATLENAKYVYSVFHTLGLSDAKISGVLGNWSIESSVDSATIEGIYDEHHNVNGPKHQEALADLSAYTVNVLFPMYGDSINQSAYRASGAGQDGKYYPGLGLGQFTGPAGYSLVAFADGANKEWYELDVQLAYCLSPDGYRPSFFPDWIEDGDTMTAADAARYFLVNWEGIDNGTHPQRQAKAEYWLTEMATWTADTAYANSVIEMSKNTTIGALSSDNNAKLKECGKEDTSFEGVIGADIKVEDVEYGHSDPSVNDINFKEYMSTQLASLIGADGNIKEEYAALTNKKSIVSEYNKWIGQCVGWSEARICSYVEERYGVKVTIGVFGDGGVPYKDNACLHTPPIDSPIPNCVFSYTSDGAGHTGYVEYVCPNGGLITSECNVDKMEHFFICYVPPGCYDNWKFFSVDDIYEVNKGSSYWNR